MLRLDYSIILLLKNIMEKNVLITLLFLILIVTTGISYLIKRRHDRLLKTLSKKEYKLFCSQSDPYCELPGIKSSLSPIVRRYLLLRIKIETMLLNAAMLEFMSGEKRSSFRSIKKHYINLVTIREELTGSGYDGKLIDLDKLEKSFSDVCGCLNKDREDCSNRKSKLIKIIKDLDPQLTRRR